MTNLQSLISRVSLALLFAHVCTQSSCLFWGDPTNSTPLTTTLGSAPNEAPTAQLRLQNEQQNVAIPIFLWCWHILSGLSSHRSNLLHCFCSVRGHPLRAVSGALDPFASFACCVRRGLSRSLHFLFLFDSIAFLSVCFGHAQRS